MSDTPTTPKQHRGFACLTPERRRQIASTGGKTAHARGKAHTWDSTQAREAGRKGGTAKAANARKGQDVGTGQDNAQTAGQDVQA